MLAPLRAGAPPSNVVPGLVAAVYVLFSEVGGVPSVVLIKRAEHLGRHRGEWAFPGGRCETLDCSLHDTALRETEEELGIQRSLIEPWGELDAVVTASGFLVWPFTGRLLSGAALEPSDAEVAEVVRVPLAALVDPSSVRTISQLQGESIRTVRAYAYNGRIIWGATARILGQVINAVSEN